MFAAFSFLAQYKQLPCCETDIKGIFAVLSEVISKEVASVGQFDAMCWVNTQPVCCVSSVVCRNVHILQE